MKVFVSLDLMGYHNKPSKKEIIEIKKRTAHNHLHIELSELAHEIGDLGFAFIPGILSGGLKSENCVGMQLFALDFDGGISFNEIKTRCDVYGLPIAFAYHTFSSSPEKEKFRIVFVHEYYIYDAYVVKIILDMLYIIFPECDSACKNPDRLFLGGKNLFYFNNNARFSMVQLPPILYRIWSKNRHLAEKARNFCNHHNILMVNGCMAIGLTENLSIPEEISASMDQINIHIIGESTNAQISILECKGLHPTKTRTHSLTRLNISGNINCQLLQDFNNGAELGHLSKFLILTNLKFINGGVKHFFNILKQVENDKDTIKKWEYDFKATISNYNPAGCSTDYCPYYSICNNDTNILATLRQDHKITCKQQCNYVKVEEAYESMRQNLLKAHNSHEPGIHLIQAQTALGKTSAYIRLIAENPDKKFIVALPTNILKMQVYNDLLTKGGLSPNEIFITASIRDPLVLLPQKIINRVIYFHNCGLHNMQADIISEHYNQIKDDPQRTAEANQCIRLLSGIELFKDERVIVTTHAKFLQMPKNSLDEYTIIIDEDILYLQIMSHIRTISIETLKQLKNCKIKYFSAIAEKILAANEGEYIKLKPAPYAAPLTEEQLKYFGLRCNEDNNINDLLLAGSAVIKGTDSSKASSVQYFCPTKLPAAKYIVLSATLNEHLYREYFGQKLKITAYPQEKARYKGKLIQFSYHTLGRNSLSRNMGVFDFARTLSGNPKIPIITFKKFEKQDLSGYNLHYGNATGINELEGQDLVVIGTPYKAEEIYKLFACYLKADIDFEKDKAPRPRRVNYNGYNFLITTYEDALLREIQLHSLESELEQAIGRARLLRYDCTVWVFSAFPCEYAELHMNNYLKES